MRFSPEHLQELRAAARRRVEQSRLERAIAILDRYQGFVPFASGPDSDLTPAVLKRANAIRLWRRRRDQHRA